MDNSGKVQLRNNTECDVMGAGNVKIRIHDGIVRSDARSRVEEEFDFFGCHGCS